MAGSCRWISWSTTCGPTSLPRTRAPRCGSSSRAAARRSDRPAAVAFEQGGYRLADADLDAVRFADLVADGRRHLEDGRSGASRGTTCAMRCHVAWRCARRRALRPVRRRAGDATRARTARRHRAARGGRPGVRATPRPRSASSPVSSASTHCRRACGHIACWRSTAPAGRPTRCAPSPRCASILAEQLGLDPGPELRAARGGDPSAARAISTAGAHGRRAGVGDRRRRVGAIADRRA